MLSHSHLLLRCLAAFSLLVCLVALPASDAYTVQRDAAGNEKMWDLTNAAELATINDGAVQFHIGTTPSQYASTFTGGVSEFAAMRRGIQAWADVPYAAITTEYAGLVENPEASGTDEKNVIFLDPDSAVLDDSTLAITTLTTDAAGTILDADITLNDRDFAWDTLGNRTTGEPGRPYIESVVARHVGFALGLDRSFVGRAALGEPIGPGSIRELRLHSDDRAGLAAMYPASEFADDFGEIRGTVATDTAADAEAVQVAALRLSDWQIVAAALTDEAGEYSLQGLEPGEYWLIAAPIRPEEMHSEGYANATTGVFPQVHGVATSSTSSPSVFEVDAGAVIATGADFTLSTNTDDGFEPNDTPTDATPLALGEAAVGRVMDASDVDTFRLDGVAPGDELDLVVLAYAAGSELDARLTVIGDDESTVLVSPSPVDAEYLPEADDVDGAAFDFDGHNLDARLEGYTVPAGEGPSLYLQVDAFGNPGQLGWYLIAAVRPADDVNVSAWASSLTLDPPTLDAGSAETATARVETRNRYGMLLGNLASVELDVGGNVVVMSESPAGSGIWEATLNAEPAATAQLVVATAAGTPLAEARTLRHTGGVDHDESTLEVRPVDGLFADGTSQARIRVIPRDIDGTHRYDGDHDVIIQSTAGNVGSVSYNPQAGAYEATLTAADEPATATISATLDGNALAQSATLAFDALPETAMDPPDPSNGNGNGDGNGNGSDDDLGTPQGMCGSYAGSAPALLLLPLLLLLMLLAAAARRRKSGAVIP